MGVARKKLVLLYSFEGKFRVRFRFDYNHISHAWVLNVGEIYYIMIAIITLTRYISEYCI